MADFRPTLEFRRAIAMAVRAAPALLLGALLGCATARAVDVGPELDGALVAYQPILGPGALFASVDEAAIDGLAWCYLQARHDGSFGRTRGGSIRPVEGGGYTYDAIVAAPRNRSLVHFVVRPADVAHFRHYPRPDRRKNEFHSKDDRRNVDRTDPLHRPSYLLTPGLVVRIYTGEGNENLLARIDRREIGRLRYRIRER